MSFACDGIAAATASGIKALSCDGGPRGLRPIERGARARGKLDGSEAPGDGPGVALLGLVVLVPALAVRPVRGPLAARRLGVVDACA